MANNAMMIPNNAIKKHVVRLVALTIKARERGIQTVITETLASKYMGQACLAHGHKSPFKKGRKTFVKSLDLITWEEESHLSVGRYNMSKGMKTSNTR